MSLHPSFLELYRASLGAGAPETAAHVSSCAQCRSHLDRLGQPMAVPGWAARLESARAGAPWYWGLLAGAVVAGMVVMLLVERRPPAQGPAATRGSPAATRGSPAATRGSPAATRGSPAATGGREAIGVTELADKGVPSVAVYIKRGERVALWDGRSAVRPGDRLRLELARGGFRYVTVASHGDFRQPLYAGEAEGDGPAFLPAGWVVDEQPQAETLELVLSRKPLDAAELAQASTMQRRDREIWTTSLVLPKAPQ